MNKRRYILLVGAAIAFGYLVVLFAPAFMGKVTDKDAAFASSMTAIGGKAVNLRAQQTLDWCGDFESLCEIGPGRGVILSRMPCDARYYAIDCDRGVIERLSAAYPGATLYLGYAPPLPAEMPRVDAIVCENVLEHMTGYRQADELIQAFYDSLNPGGRLVLRVPDIRRIGWGFWENGASDHQYVTGLVRATLLCRDAGFRIERSGHAIDHMTGARGWLTYQVLRCFPWRVMHELFYEPWQMSPWSKLSTKVPHAYVVAVKD